LRIADEAARWASMLRIAVGNRWSSRPAARGWVSHWLGFRRPLGAARRLRRPR